MLVSPAIRCELAQNLANLLVQAHTPSGMRNPRVQLNRGCIVACEPEIHEMINAVLTPLPTSARGTAMVSWLLTDGTGPLYNRRCSAELGTALTRAIAQLDPSVFLVSSA